MLLITGCGGGPASTYRYQEAEELRFQNARREEELKKAEEAVRILKAQAAALASEKDALQAQITDLKSQVRAQRQGTDQLEAEKGAVEERLRQATERQEELKKTLERASSLLGFVAGEVASLRNEWRGIEANAARPRKQAEDLDFVEKNALYSAKIEQLHFELLRERALLGGFSRPRPSQSGPTPAQPGMNSEEPAVAAQPFEPAKPWSPAKTAQLPRPMMEPREPSLQGDGTQEAAPTTGFWARVGDAISSAWRLLPVERMAKALQLALFIACGAIFGGVIAVLGKRGLRRMKAARLARSSPMPLEPAEEAADAAAEEPLDRHEEDTEETTQIEPDEPREEEASKPGGDVIEVPAAEPARKIEEPAVEGPQAETPVVAESADFFRAFQEREKKKPAEPPLPKPRPQPARTQPAAPRRPEETRPVAHPTEDRTALGETTNLGPEATQRLDEEAGEAAPGEGTYTQVIPDVDSTEWNLTEELPTQRQDDFLSTQVISPIPDIETPRPPEPFPAAEEGTDETSPTQVIKEPEGLKGPGWTVQKGAPHRPSGGGKGAKPPARPRPEKQGRPRKGPPSDQDLLAELEELIGRKIDEPTR
jgi:hypothetical protein